MSPEEDSPLDRLVLAVLKSRKYRTVCPDFIRRLGVQELEKRKTWNQAVKAVKTKLHQVGGAFLDEPVDFRTLRETLKSTSREKGTGALRSVFTELMGSHASTRERLAILEPFYSTLFAGISPPRHILDIACGLHPLGIPWMSLPPPTLYTAYDIYGDLVDFLETAFDLLPVQGEAQVCDVIHLRPPPTADTA
ncbi:MAG: class I SAM-dependent methyltransferase, partial [Planctomycetota bacterium]